MSINSPASAGMAMLPTTSPSATITRPMTTAATSSDCRDLAPASLFNDEAETDPPTGMPCSRPDATLAAPWPTKSRDAFG
jgi:hypothetical protein